MSQVADALDDARMDEWIEMAADRLHEFSTAQSHGGLDPQQIADILLTLSASVQHRLFSATTRLSDRVQNLQEFLPAHMHQTVFAATITPHGVLEVPLYDDTLPYLKAMTTLPPSILSFTVRNPEGTAIPAQTWQDATPHLAQIVQHHSAMTSLFLRYDCDETASVMLLRPAITSLKSLRALALGTGIDPTTSTALQQMLRALPHLQALELSLVLVSKSLKRQRTRGSSGGPTQLCLATLLSPATALTSLRLIRVQAADAQGRFVVTKPLKLPCLSRLEALFARPVDTAFTGATTECASIASSHLLSHLSAPLTSLNLRPEHRWLQVGTDEYHAHIERLHSNLTRFTLLRHLCIGDPSDGRGNDWGIWHAHADAAPPALGKLRQLEHLHFAAGFYACLEALPLLAGATALTNLHLDCWSHGHDAPWETSEFIGGIAALPLRHLNLDLEINNLLPGIASLLEHGLTRLTALRTKGWGCLSSAEDVAALGRVTGLQTLHLLEAGVEEELHASAVSALQALPALTALAHTSDSPGGSLSDALVAEATPYVWPALQELSMELWHPYDTDEVFSFARTRPALTWLGFDIQRKVRPAEEDESHADVVARIKRQASDAGITVSFDDDFEF